MRATRFSLRTIATVAMALTTTGFGARMIDYAGPAEARPSGRPEETEAAVTEMEDEDDPTEKDDELSPEMPEGSEDDLPVAAIPAAPPSRWKWSQSVTLGLSTDDNIYLSANHKESDQILTLTGHFQLLWGLKREESFLRIDYLPSLIRFEDHSQSNGFDQTVELEGQWRMAKLTLGVQAEVQSLSGADLDVGTRTTRRVWQFALQARYDLSTKASLEVNLAPNATNYDNYLGSLEWVESNWIDYQVLPKTRLGAGLVLGVLKPEGGLEQTYQQALVRLRNPFSGKVTVSASGGIEFRELGGGAGTRTMPVFRIGASYKPVDRTEISVEAARQNFSSATVAHENFTTTGGSVSVRQHLSDRLFARVTGGYEDATYEGTTMRGGTLRHDRYFFVRPSLTLGVTKWMSLEAYYQYRRNASTLSLSSFDDTVAGLQTTVNF